MTAAENTAGENKYVIHEGKVIDLGKIDVEDVRKAISCSPYKALEIDDLKEFIEKALQQLINKNVTRVAFSQRYRNIIDKYNAGGSENEDYYEQLLKLMEELRKEQARTTEMGLAEEELEIYDLLIQGRKLTKAEEQKVILASKNLYKKLVEARKDILVVDWYKDEQPREKVRAVIQEALNADLPESYDKPVFDAKTNLLLSHLWTWPSKAMAGFPLRKLVFQKKEAVAKPGRAVAPRPPRTYPPATGRPRSGGYKGEESAFNALAVELLVGLLTYSPISDIIRAVYLKYGER